MKKLLIALFALVMMPSMAYALPLSIIIRSTGGEDYVYNSQNVKEVRLTADGGATLSLADGNEVALPADVFGQLRFDPNELDENHYSGISSAIIANETAVKITDLEGREIHSTVAALPAGVYLITVDGVTTKTIVK